MTGIVSPQILNLHLKRFKNIIKNQEEDYESAIKSIDIMIEREFDACHFSISDVEIIKNKMLLAQLLLFMSVPNSAITELDIIRKMLDRCFLSHLWMPNRLMKSEVTSAEIGSLADLPELVRFKIHKIIFDCL